jgi:uncharacterized protein YdgA (DUF945 family)
MKRWFVVLLVLLAVVILLSPAIVGRLAEQNIEQNIEWAESDSPGVSIRTERFDRGWLASEGRHRIVLEGGQFRGVAASYTEATGNPELPSLIIDTHLDHGPLPAGSMAPGLASAVSTFMIDPGNGTPFEIPGALTSKVSLGGASSSHLLLEPGTYEHEEATFEWQGADMVFDSDPSTGAVSAEGEIKPWKVSAGGMVADLDVLTVSADQVRTPFGFNVGTVNLQMGEIKLEEDGVAFSVGRMSVSADSSIEDDRLSGSSMFKVEQMTVPEVGTINLDMDMSMQRVDAASIAVIGKAIQDAQSSADPETALANLYPAIQEETETLFRKGFTVRLDKLDLSLPQGVVNTTLELDVPESAADADFSWSSVLLRMSASIDLRIPGAIFEMAAMMNDQAGALVAMGILIPDGEDFVMDAEYAQGLINVNGVPMPIPIPGL